MDTLDIWVQTTTPWTLHPRVETYVRRHIFSNSLSTDIYRVNQLVLLLQTFTNRTYHKKDNRNLKRTKLMVRSVTPFVTPNLPFHPKSPSLSETYAGPLSHTGPKIPRSLLNVLLHTFHETRH